MAAHLRGRERNAPALAIERRGRDRGQEFMIPSISPTLAKAQAGCDIGIKSHNVASGILALWEPMQIESLEISELTLDPANARKHSDKNLEAIKGSLKKFGQQKPIVVDKNGVVVAGNGTLTAAKALGWKKINAVRTELTGPEAIAFALADNRTAELAEWDLEPLNKTLQSLKDIDFDLGAIGFDAEFLGEHLGEESEADGSGEPGSAKLSDTFLVPPFTVLDARQGYWQERKRQWLSLGIKSELGRGGGQQVTSFKSQGRLDAFRQTKNKS